MLGHWQSITTIPQLLISSQLHPYKKIGGGGEKKNNPVRKWAKNMMIRKFTEEKSK